MLFTYDPSIHDYSTDKPELVCIGHDHWVFGNKKEIEEYKATREKNVPLKTITILDKDAEIGSSATTSSGSITIARAKPIR